MNELLRCVQGTDAQTLSALRDGELDPTTTADVQAHVASCPACQNTLAEYQEMTRRLRHQRELDSGRQVWVGVHAAIQTRRDGFMARRPQWQRHVSSRTVGAGIGVAIALVMLFVLFFVALGELPRKGAVATSTPIRTATATSIATGTPLPNFVGQTYGAIKYQLVQLQLNYDLKHIACPAGQENIITAQDPAAGTPITPGLRAVFTVCAGPDYVQVPDVTLKTSVDACNALKAVGLLCAQTLVSSATVPAGIVVTTQPPPGADSNTGATITIAVSTGPGASTVQIQNAPVAQELTFAYVGADGEVWVVVQGAAPRRVTHLQAQIQAIS